MAISRYLAMTAAEIRENRDIRSGIAWMACHFSAECRGVAGLPDRLPGGSVLMLNDRIPLASPDIPSICRTLTGAVLSLGCRGLLLDFQRPGEEAVVPLADALAHCLPCPVIVSDLYAKELDCPVFLSPVPLHSRLANHLALWKGREIWLDISTEGERITLTEQGSAIEILCRFQGKEKCHQDNRLHCHYSISVSEEKAEFTLWRTRQDLEKLLQEADDCGVKAAVGLYQELNTW